ncbi:MAG TPA: AAA family ATPase [Blastocatellia bacterium]|nr:AAA family ATPase [Blastocatellia bacterium]
MPILSFSFNERVYGWKLNKVTFQDFNLLVGLSGVGKSNILRSLLIIRRAGAEPAGSIYANGCDWTVNIQIGEDLYEWSATVSVSASTAFSIPAQNGSKDDWTYDPPLFIQERLFRNGLEIVSRDESGMIRYRENALPKYRGTDSIISLFSEEETVSPLYQFLSKITFSESVNYGSAANEVFSTIELFPLPKVEEISGHFTSIEQLRELRSVPLLVKAYILQKNFPQIDRKLKEEYCEMFGTVSEIRIGTFEEMMPRAISANTSLNGYITLGIKEKGVDEWILGHLISNGMLRVLIYLFELEMLPADTVLLIDEFEDGLGVNCLSGVTDILLRHIDKQFILTSHHPYVINNIPWRYWKLVTRHGSEVTVKDATSIPALNTASSLEKFTQLLNLEEYEEAIQ